MPARALRLAAAAPLLVAAATSEFPEGDEQELEAQVQVAHLLSLYETREEINLFMLAAAWPTDEDVALVCELPVDGSPRRRDACTVHPRRSNRGLWRVYAPKSDRKYRTLKGRRETEAEYEKLQVEARAILARARTALELSRRVGQGPDACKPLGGDRLRCLWRADRHSWGHGTLATSILASLDKKVRLQCALPVEGGEREKGSCAVSIGA